MSSISFLQGKKTYLVALVAIIYAVSAYFTGHIGFENATQLVLGALGIGALRNGISGK